MGRLIIVGCSRSGTQYTSRVLQELGLKVKHEDMGEQGTVDAFLLARGGPEPDDTVWHQVRHPLAVIASLGHVGMPGQHVFERIGQDRPPGGEQNGPWARPGFRARFWLDWTALCDEYSSWRYRVEDVPSHMFTTPRNQNTRGGPPLSWNDLFKDDHQVANQVYARAVEYGYDPNLWLHMIKWTGLTSATLGEKV